MPILPNILRTLLSAIGNESTSRSDLSRSDPNNNRNTAIRPHGRQRNSMMNQVRSMGDGFHNPANRRTHVNKRQPTNNVVSPAVPVNRTNNRKNQISSKRSRVEQKPSGKPTATNTQTELASKMQGPKHKNPARIPKIKKTDRMTQTNTITKANIANWRKFTTIKGSQLTLRIKIYKTMLMFDNIKGCSFQKLKKYLNIVYGYNPKQLNTLKKYILEAFENKMIQVVTGNSLDLRDSGTFSHHINYYV